MLLALVLVLVMCGMSSIDPHHLLPLDPLLLPVPPSWMKIRLYGSDERTQVS